MRKPSGLRCWNDNKFTRRGLGGNRGVLRDSDQSALTDSGCPLERIACRVNPASRGATGGTAPAFLWARIAAAIAARLNEEENDAQFCEDARGAGAGARSRLWAEQQADGRRTQERPVAGVVDAAISATAVRVADGAGLCGLRPVRATTCGLSVPDCSAAGGAAPDLSGAVELERDVL